MTTPVSTVSDRFLSRSAALGSLLCVGLDPDPTMMASKELASDPLRYLETVIEATSDFAVAYKPNLAFFEADGVEGWRRVERVVSAVRRHAPGAILIADAKRGDIGNTADFYARTFFSTFDFDAVTLSPYMGMDTIAPFASYRERAAILLCHTSNPGAADLQLWGTPPLYLRVAELAAQMQRQYGNLWLVVGATRESTAVAEIRRVAPELPFLIPGVGAQGGDLAAVLAASGRMSLINASRAILYPAIESGHSAESGSDSCWQGLAFAAGSAAAQLACEIRSHLNRISIEL